MEYEATFAASMQIAELPAVQRLLEIAAIEEDAEFFEASQSPFGLYIREKIAALRNPEDEVELVQVMQRDALAAVFGELYTDQT